MQALTSFLTNPVLAFAGLVLGTVPVIIHLLNRTFYEQHEWAAMDFLLRAEQKTRRRVRLENLLLMILRYLLLALLGFALAQPFFNEPALAFLGSQPGHFIIVLDESYSMRTSLQPGGETSRHDDAREQVKEILNNRFRPARGDRVSVISSSAAPKALIETPSQDRARALRVIEESTPTFYSGGLLETLDLVDQTMDAASDELNQQVIWVTDLQAKSWLPADESTRNQLRREISQLTERVQKFSIKDTGREETANIGIAELDTVDQLLVDGRPIDVRTRIQNFSDSNQSATVSLFQNERKVQTLDVNLDAGESLEKEFDPVRFDTEGAHAVYAELSGDRLQVDNRRYRALNIKKKIDVLVVDGEPEEGNEVRAESYFLKSALRPEEGTTPFRLTVVTDYMFQDERLADYDVVMLANVSTVTAERRDELRNFLQNGGGVMMFLGDRTTLDAFNETLYDVPDPLLPGKLTKIVEQSPDQGNYVTLDELNLEHPALTFFQPYPEKLSSLMTFGRVQMDVPEDALDVQVLARFGDPSSSPAIAERSIGRGKFITVLTSADMDWNYWPEFQGYVLLIDQLTQYLLRQKEGFRNVRVGRDVHLPVEAFESSSSFRLTNPDEQVTVKSPRPLREGGYVVRLDVMDRPGLYLLEQKREDQSTWRSNRVLSANVNPDEGDLKRVSNEKLTDEYPGISFESLQREISTSAERPRTNLWMFLASLVLVFLGLESLLALRIDRRRQI